MISEFEIKRRICDIGERIYKNGFVAANDGNISVRTDNDEIIATPTGVSKGFMTPDMLVKTDLEGNIISGKLRPSSELKMHLDVYRQRENVKSVVHAHPPTATGFAVAGIPLDEMMMPEVIISLGTIPIAEYGTPSTREIPDAVSKYLDCYDAVLLENHGALTVGADLTDAYFKMETIELAAKINITARQLGGVNEISDENVRKLYEVREKMGVEGKHPRQCNLDNIEENDSGSDVEQMELVSLVSTITEKVIAELE